MHLWKHGIAETKCGPTSLSDPDPEAAAACAARVTTAARSGTGRWGQREGRIAAAFRGARHVVERAAVAAVQDAERSAFEVEVDRRRQEIGDDELYIVDVATSKVTILARAMGYLTPDDVATGKTYLPFGAEDLAKNYYPTLLRRLLLRDRARHRVRRTGRFVHLRDPEVLEDQRALRLLRGLLPAGARPAREHLHRRLLRLGPAGRVAPAAMGQLERCPMGQGRFERPAVERRLPLPRKKGHPSLASRVQWASSSAAPAIVDRACVCRGDNDHGPHPIPSTQAPLFRAIAPSLARRRDVARTRTTRSAGARR